jgi:hypothetical protein
MRCDACTESSTGARDKKERTFYFAIRRWRENLGSFFFGGTTQPYDFGPVDTKSLQAILRDMTIPSLVPSWSLDLEMPAGRACLTAGPFNWGSSKRPKF